jgi:hypothetical protein
VALDHAVRLRVEGCGAGLVHSSALQNLLHQTVLEVTALFAMELPQYSEAPVSLQVALPPPFKPLDWEWRRLPAT